MLKKQLKPMKWLRDFWAWIALGAVGGSAIGLFVPASRSEHQPPVQAEIKLQSNGGAAPNQLDQFKAKISQGQKFTSEEELRLTDEIDKWMLSDPVSCLNWLDSNQLLSLVSQKQCVESLWTVAGEDFTALLNLVREVSSPLFRNSALKYGFSIQAGKRPESLFDVIGLLPVAIRKNLSDILIEKCVDKDPALAVEGLLKKNLPNCGILDDMMLRWAQKDPKGAWAAYLTAGASPENAKKFSCGDTLLSYIATARPEFALGLYNSASGANLNLEKTERLLRVIEWNYPEKFKEILSKDHVNLRDLRAATDVVRQLLVKGDSKASQLVDLLPGERARALVVAKAAQDRAMGNAKDAANWANEQQDPFAKRAAVAAVANHWALNHPEEACEYAINQGGAWQGAIFQAIRVTLGRSDLFVDASGSWIRNTSNDSKNRIRVEIEKLPQTDKMRQLLPLLKK